MAGKINDFSHGGNSVLLEHKIVFLPTELQIICQDFYNGL